MRGEPYPQKREILKSTFGFENRPAKKSFMKLVDFSSGVFFTRYRSASSLALGTPAQNLDFLFCGESPQECGKIFGCRRGWFFTFEIRCRLLRVDRKPQLNFGIRRGSFSCMFGIEISGAEIIVDNTLPCVIQVGNESERSQENKARTRG